jgi:heme-degrading monooxygenase HmoA
MDPERRPEMPVPGTVAALGARRRYPGVRYAANCPASERRLDDMIPEQPRADVPSPDATHPCVRICRTRGRTGPIASSDRRGTEAGQGAQMIARTWRGWASTATADDYQRHYETDVAEHLQRISGFCGARLLRRDAGDEVLFTSITYFASMDAVRAFAGDDPERAVVEDAASRALTRWDERVSHHNVVVDLPPPAEIDRAAPS